jgi:cobalt-zinc-cadmium efflux system membrane fusion protein
MNRKWILGGSVKMAFAFAGLLLVGCSRHDHPRDDQDHHHEEKTAQITVWSDRYEIFAEHRLVAAGVDTKFVTHVTDLQTLEPRREGPIRFRLLLGQESPVEKVEPTPTRAGIYEAMLNFPKPGTWNIRVMIPTESGEAEVILPPVKVYASTHDAQHGDAPEAPEGVSFLKEQQWKILARAEPIPKRRLVERVRVAARVRAKPGFSATIAAPVSGQLAAPPGQALPQPGHRVEAGQLLALLQPNFSEAGAKVGEAQAGFATAKAVLDQAEAAYNRTKKLAADQAKSPRELQEMELAYQSAKARYAAAAGLLATFKQAGAVTNPDAPLSMELRAPIAGVLNSVAAGPGEIVAAQQAIFTVLNPETVWIEARLPESHVARLSQNKDATVEVPGDAGRFTAITGDGRGQLLSLGLAVDATTRTIPLLYETANREGQFRIGQNVTLHVETARAEETIAVPESALLEEGDQLVAFVQVSGETFEKRAITAGIRDAGFVQVLDGIKEGERVVTKGASAIRLSSISGVIPAHGHAH